MLQDCKNAKMWVALWITYLPTYLPKQLEDITVFARDSHRSISWTR
jgi:hypothetical protein